MTEHLFLLVDCKVCDGSGTVWVGDLGEWTTSTAPDRRRMACPCRYRRPCDLMCRCSGGPL